MKKKSKTGKKPADILTIRLRSLFKNGKATQAGLAAWLGYKHSAAVNMWLVRGRVPGQMRKRVETYLKSAQ